MTSDGCNFHFSFWAIFCPFFIPLTAPKIKIYEKIKKTTGDIIISHEHQKHVQFLSYDARWIDGQSEGRTNGKSDIQRWVPYLKIIFKVGYTKVKLSLLSPN